MTNSQAIANKYAEQVISGKVSAGQLVREACARYLSDLNTFRFEPELADHALEFIQNLTHTTGEAAGRKFILEPWQVFIITNLFGFVGPDGARRFSRAYIEVPRKNGKSTFASAIMLYGLLADGEAGAQPGADAAAGAGADEEGDVVDAEYTEEARDN